MNRNLNISVKTDQTNQILMGKFSEMTFIKSNLLYGVKLNIVSAFQLVYGCVIDIVCLYADFEFNFISEQ